MQTKDAVITIRLTKADRDLLKRTVPGGSVSGWLRELALAEARKRRAALDLVRLLKAAQPDPDLGEEDAADLAAEAVRAVRKRKR